MSGTAVALSGQAEQLQKVVAQFNLKKGEAGTTSSTPTDTAKPSRNERKTAHGSVSRCAAPARPAKSQSKDELELVGAAPVALTASKSLERPTYQRKPVNW